MWRTAAVRAESPSAFRDLLYADGSERQRGAGNPSADNSIASRAGLAKPAALYTALASRQSRLIVGPAGIV